MNDLKYLKEKVEETLELLGLKDRKNEKAYSLSKGLKQRVGLAIAMVHEPEILLLDEPTSGLDPNATKRFLDLLRELNRNSTTILFSTHILSLAEKICDDVVIIDKGKILLTSKIDDAKAKLRSKDLEDVYFSITEGAYESY
jgi:ABC-2 type transport system ATP-binding protein